MAGDALLPLASDEARPLAAALVVLPVVLGILGGLLGLISGALGDEPREPFTRPSVGERLVGGLPAALYIGWLAAFGVAYSQAIAWFDWRLVGAIVAGIVVVEVVAAVIGRWRAGFGLFIGFSIGAGIGVIVGAFTAVAFHWRVGIAIGFTVGLATTLAMLALEATHIKVDEESLKARFYPSRTIEMTKER
jgi:MFS family permease